MSCGQLTPEVTRRLVAYSTTEAIEWYTDWMFCCGIDTVRRMLANRNVTATASTFQTRFYVQVAKARTDNPETPVTWASTYVTGNAEASANQSVSTQASAGFFIRFGVGYSLTTGSTPVGGDVTLQVAFDACGDVVGQATFEVQNANTGDVNVPVSGWFPGIQVDLVNVAIVATGLSGVPQWRWIYQTAPTVTSVVDAWAAGGAGTYLTAAGDSNSTDTTLAVGATKFWCRLGLGFASQTGGTLSQATFTVLVAIRRT
jgi:hypothetical protein